MRKFSFTLAILLIAATIIGTVNAVSVADYIAEGNAHFAAGELAQAWDAFKWLKIWQFMIIILTNK